MEPLGAIRLLGSALKRRDAWTQRGTCARHNHMTAAPQRASALLFGLGGLASWPPQHHRWLIRASESALSGVSLVHHTARRVCRSVRASKQEQSIVPKSPAFSFQSPAINNILLLNQRQSTGAKSHHQEVQRAYICGLVYRSYLLLHYA